MGARDYDHFLVAFSTGIEGDGRSLAIVIFDVPVSLDAAGNPLRKTRFELRMQSRSFVNTYTRESSFAEAKLVGTTNEEATTQPPPQETQPAPSTSAFSITRTEIMNAQIKLNELGCSAGPADGLAGQRTISAISKFQSDKGCQLLELWTLRRLKFWACEILQKRLIWPNLATSPCSTGANDQSGNTGCS